MASCELKNELAKLQEKKDKLANRAKNELALSELVLSGKELLSAEVELLKIALGNNIAKLAQAVSTEYITVKTANEGISHVDILSAIQKEINDMLVAIKNDKAVATKLEVLKIDKPDNKYMLLNLNLLTDADGKYTQMMLNALNGDAKTARRQELLQSQIDEAVKELREIHGKVPKAVYDKKYDKYEELLKRQNGQALSDALKAVDGLVDKKAKPGEPPVVMFPSIYVLTESEKHKAIRDAEGKKPLSDSEHTFRSAATMSLEQNTLAGTGVQKGEAGLHDFSSIYELSPLAILLGYKTGDRSFDLPDYVKNTIKINALSHMDDIYKVLSYEVGSQEFNEAWGIDINTISEEEMALVQTKHIEGNIPQAVVLKSLGKAIYAGLPAKFAKNVDVELEQRAIVQLGLYAVRYMNAIGLVRLGESMTINGGSKTHVPIMANISDEVVDGIVPASSIMNLVAELQHIGAAESRNAPRDANEVHEVSQTIRNSFMETSETVRENLKAFENTEFKFNDHARLLYDMYTNDGKAGKEAAYAMAGVLSVDTSKPVIEQMKEMSKINYGKMQVDAFIEAYREFGLDGKPFKLPYDYTVSGRYMINSILNPQESKITRYLVSTKDIESVINVDTDANGIKTLNSQDLDIFKLGVSQAFDRDPDKHSDIVALEDLEKVVSISRTGQVEFVKMLKNKDGTEYKNPFNVIYEALNDGSLNGESVIGEELKKALMAVNRTGAGFHAMQAIMALKQLNDATAKGLSEPVTLGFSLESDAITSGMILTLMQIGTPKAMELAAKGGVYTKEALAKWEKLHGMYVTAANATDRNPIEALKQKDGKSFKLTHGWLLDFTADISKRLENEEFVKAMYEQLEPQTQEYIQAQAEANGVELMSQAKETISKLSDFKDFYNTVAGSANADMKKIKAQAQAEKDALMDQVAAERTGSNKQRDLLKDAAAKSVEIALIDVVGDVTRKLAKPSVMVYIYGAMLSSIKKKMVDAVVMPKVYDIVKKVNSLYPDGLNYDGFMAFINSSEVVKNNFITQSEQIVLQTVFNGTAMQFKKLSGSTFVNDDAKLMKNVIIPEKAAQKLAPATNETLGKAFETGFKAFGEIDNYRDSVKAAEVVRFTMFKYKLKQGLEKVKERLGDREWRISAKDIASVIMQLEKDGFGHSVTDINGGRQPLYKKDELEKAFITILAMDKYKPVSSAIEGKEYGPNTGASGVITVHNIDGFIDAVSAKAFDLVRIYDGSVSGINKMNESLEAYNDVVLQTTSWNSYIQQIKDLVNQIGKLEENGEIKEMLDSISDADRVSLLNTVQKLMGYGDIRELDIDEAIKSKTQSVVDRVTAAEAFRNGGETELAIMHSYLTDSADMHIGKMAYGESNHLEPEAVGKLYEMYGNILHAIAGNDVNIEEASEGQDQIVKIDSTQDGLEFALTNPTHTTPKGFKRSANGYKGADGKIIPWTDSQKWWMKHLENGISFNGKQYDDSEAAYQANKTKNDDHDYKLMVDVLTAKLTQYPVLVQGINKKGGMDYLNRAVHAPTGKATRWETGGKDLFVKALKETYTNVSSGSNSQAKPFNDKHADNAKTIKDIMLKYNVSEEEALIILDAADEKINEDC